MAFMARRGSRLRGQVRGDGQHAGEAALLARGEGGLEGSAMRAGASGRRRREGALDGVVVRRRFGLVADRV
jgi:hypothetical protein